MLPKMGIMLLSVGGIKVAMVGGGQRGELALYGILKFLYKIPIVSLELAYADCMWQQHSS